jgi:hypothetical protein
MAKTISISELGAAIEQELNMYQKDVIERVDAAGEKAIKKMVKLAKASAPEWTGRLKKNITHKVIKNGVLGTGNATSTYVLHAKAPSHRVFHLAVHGHATVNGGRAKGNPFLKNAVDAVLPEYEEDVEEALIP